MSTITKVSKVSNLNVLSKAFADAQVLLAYARKNYANPLSDIAGNKIIGFSQIPGSENNGLNVIKIKFQDGTSKYIYVYDGETGDKGKKGKTGEDGDQGAPAFIEGNGSLKQLTIVNNCDTVSGSSALSALQGKLMNDKLITLEETFMTDEKYNILFNNFIYMDCEFTTYGANSETRIFNSDNSNHKKYVKYWTYENGAGETYYIFNQISNDYDQIAADEWKDVYLGDDEGYFAASSNQLIDGTKLYVYNTSLETFVEVTLVTDKLSTIVQKTNEAGEPLYTDPDTNEETTEDTGVPVMIEGVLETYRGGKEFSLYDNKLTATIDVTYNASSDKYIFNLHATELVPEVYELTGYQDGEPVYTKLTEEQLTTVDTITTTYYELTKGEYVAIPNITTYLSVPNIRYYIKSNNVWTEVKSINNIDTANYQEYIICTFSLSSNTYTYTRYYKRETFLVTEYLSETSVYNKSSINYYVYYDGTTNKHIYYTKVYNEDGSFTFKEVAKLIWLNCEFTTLEEDEVTRIFNNDKSKDISPANPSTTLSPVDADEEIIKPIYIDKIEITSELDIDDDGELEEPEIKVLEIAIDAVSDFDIKTYPENANVTDLIVEYDENVITLYEDGRIAAVKSTNVTSETTITIMSAHDPNVKTSVKLKIVTPIAKLTLPAEQEALTLYVGKNAKLTPILTPTNVSNPNIIWESTDPENVSVDDNGNVTPLKPGTTSTIMAKAADGYGASVTCNILVAIPATDFEITSYSYAFVNVPNQLSYVFTPEDVTITSLDWKLSYVNTTTYIASITDNGVLTAVAPGNVIVSATTKDGTNITKSKEFELTYGVSEITIEPSTLSIEEFKTYQFAVEATPSYAANLDVIWSTDDEKVASITYDGLATFHTMGNAIITATAADGTGTIANSNVTITRPVSAITLNTNVAQVFVGGNLPLINSIEPVTATTQTVSWSSVDESIATVTNNGTVRGVSAGKTTIVCAANDNSGIYTTCVIDVLTAVNTLTIDIVETNIDIEKSITLVATIAPDNATIQNVTWTSSDTSVATVESNGVVTINKIGTATITCTATDGSEVSGTMEITVVDINNADYAKLTLDKDHYKLVNNVLTISSEYAIYNTDSQTITIK